MNDSEAETPMLFTCPSCGKQAPPTEFGARTVKGIWHAQSWCRECRMKPVMLPVGPVKNMDGNTPAK